MSILLTTPPTVEPISLAEAKAHLRISHTDDDTYISTLIIAARRIVEIQYDLSLLQQSWSLYADQWPVDGVFAIPLSPLLSVVDLKVYGDDDVAATIDPAHYYIDKASFPARVALRRGRVFAPPGRGTNGLELKITTGFGISAASVPLEIKQALLIIIADWYANRGDTPDSVIPVAALELLSAYKNVRLL